MVTKKIELGLVFFMVLALATNVEAVFSDVGQLSSSSATETISVNFSPDSLFQKLRDFISIEVIVFSPKELVKNSFSGFSESIRDTIGVDIIKLFGFITGLFYKAFLWLTQLLQNIKSG